MKSLYWKGEIIMKRNVKMLLSFIMVIAMISAMSVGAFAATADNVQHYDTYTFLGDSIPAGHSMPGYSDGEDGYGDGQRIEGAYPDLVADAVGATTLHCDAMQGTNTSALRYLLDDDYEMTALTQTFMSSMTSGRYTVEKYTAMRESIRNDIAESDLVTINIGNNDVLYAVLVDTMKAKGYSRPFFGKQITEREIFDEVEALIEENGGCLEAALISALEAIEKLDNAAQIIDMLASDQLMVYQEFAENYNVILQKIRELAPDATVVCVNMFNPLRDMTISGDIEISVGHILDGAIGLYNAAIDTAAVANSCKVANVWDTEVRGTMTLEGFIVRDNAFMEALTTYVHPTAEGHAYMAKQILKVLPSTDSGSLFSSLCG